MLGVGTIVATGCTTAVGAFVQGLTSFGYAVVSWSAYSILVQLHVEMPDYHSFLVCLTCFACSTVSLFNLAQARDRFKASLPAIALAMAPEFPGNFAGVWFSHVVPVATLRLIIGGIFVAMSLPRISLELLSLAEGAAETMAATQVQSKKQMRAEASVIGRRSGARCEGGRGRAADEDRAAVDSVGQAASPGNLEDASPGSVEDAAEAEVEADIGSRALIGSRCVMPLSGCSSPGRFAAGLAFTGAASGFCHGSVGIPGPPWMLYFAFVGIDKSDARAIFATFELAGSANFLVTYAAAGQIRREHALLYTVVVLVCAGGTSLGNRLHPHVSPGGAVLSLLVLTLLSGVQALGAFDLADRTGAVLRALLLTWMASLLSLAAWRRRRRACSAGTTAAT